MTTNQPRIKWNSAAIDLAEMDRDLTATVAPSGRAAPKVEKSTLVEGTSLAYRAGMATEIRIAPRWGNAVSAYLRHLRAIDRSEKTIYLRSYQLRVFSQAFRSKDPYSLTRDDIESYMASLEHLSRSTKRSMLTTIRGFYFYAYENHQTTGVVKSPCEFIKPIEDTEGVPRPAADVDIRAALDIAEPRVKMMIFLGAYCGMRRAEIAAVHTKDLVSIGGGRMALRVKGKGKKTRKIPLTGFVASMIEDVEPGYLFPSWHRGQIRADGYVHERPITPGHVGVLMRQALPKGVTPHMLRHRYASTVYAANHDIRATGKLLGHRNVNTTQVYVAVPEDSMIVGVDAAGILAA